MKTVIKVEGLSKAYQIGQFSTGTISRDIERWWASIRGKEDPFLIIGEKNDRTKKSDSNIVWSLDDINLNIEAGDSVGIIGRNGAGKSTLLKVLSQITAPTKGSVKINGRVASLLEVGTGFHPELTGKENIFLNGAILGMQKKEIQRKFDEIVDFSGVEKYLDTPVKRYSSGMYVRLAFAVAAHLESEILIVDEVLAVGDAEFQRKCLGKMGEISKNQARTILFVSHNLISIRALCNKSVLLSNGQDVFFGPTHETINLYEKNDSESDTDILFSDTKVIGDEVVKFKHIQIYNPNNLSNNIFYREDPIQIRVQYEVMHSNEDIYLSIHVNQGGQCVFVGGVESYIHESGIYEIKGVIPENLLSNLTYSFSFILVRRKRIMAAVAENLIYLNIGEKKDYVVNVMGLMRPSIDWTNPIKIF
jgi:lipopolysaccharide transport system ATP-binding protein